jgi:hypothetical protein
VIAAAAAAPARWKCFCQRFFMLVVLLGLAAFGHDLTAREKDDPHSRVPVLQAIKVSGAMTVDGILDEPFWAECPVATGFIDQRTGRPADEQTLVRVAYSLTHLYVAVECLDERTDQIRAAERREDRPFTGDDFVQLHLDPQHTHRMKYAFFTNPLGTRADANEGPSGMFNYGWTAEWEVAAKVLPDRWVFEMKIPFGIMNYQRKDGQTWGFNVTRQLRRTDVLSFWSFNVTDTYKPRHFGHLTSMDLADSKFDRNWAFTPYVSARTDFNHETSTRFRTGVDVSFRLTPAITTALTLRPDFGQVEADDDTIELRDTERFLSEKRLFFREGDELIRMPHRLYYSRRFSDIDGGLNMSGQLDGYSFAFLNIYGDVVHQGRHKGNSAVLRLLQPAGQRSTIGYYAADSEFETGHSRVLGADAYFFLTDAWRTSLQFAGADDMLRGAGGLIKESTDFLGHASLIYDLYPWFFSLTYRAITEEFNPVLGFIPRRDIFGPSFAAGYRARSDNGWYKDLNLSYDMFYFMDKGGNLSIHDHGIYGRVVLQNDLGLRLSHQQNYHAPFHNPRTSAGLTLFSSDLWRSASIGWAGGVFREIDYHELTLAKPWKPWERLPIRHEFVIRFEDRPDGSDHIVWLNRVVFDLFLTNDMWIKASLQHRDSSVHNISVIYGWEFLRRTFWYLVFNNIKDGRTAEESSIFTKLTRTF